MYYFIMWNDDFANCSCLDGTTPPTNPLLIAFCKKVTWEVSAKTFHVTFFIYCLQNLPLAGSVDNSSVFILTFFSNFIDQLFCIFPSNTWICDRFSIDHISRYILSAFFQVTFYHNSFNHLLKIRVISARMQYLTYNTNLFFKFLVSIPMLHINHCCRILSIFILI